MLEELGRLTPHVLSAIASVVFLILIVILLILDLVLLASWVAWFVKGGYMEIGRRTWGRIASVFTNEPAPKKEADTKEETMIDEHSEWSRIVKAFTSKPLVVRSLAWAVIFAGIGLLLHPTIITRILHQNNFLGVFVVIALLFGLSMAKLTEPIYVRAQKASTIEATEFVLTHAGRVIGRFGHDDGLATLTLFFSPEGTEKVFLSTRGLALLDSEDNHRFAVGMTDSGPRLTLTNDTGDRFAQLEVSQEGPDLTLGLLDEENVIRESASLALKNAGPKVFLEGKGAATWLGVAGLDLLNLESKSRASVTVAGPPSIEMHGSLPSIQMKDGDGKVIWKIPNSA